MHDILSNLKTNKIDCLDKGYVQLVDIMPRLAPEGQTTADFAIVQAARVSYGAGTKTVNEDRGLIRYLMRHQHTTPFEMVSAKFLVKLPIVTARQIIRHRTVSVNEVSGRYSILEDTFYFPQPENIREQSKTNKQGGDKSTDLDNAQSFLDYLDQLCKDTYQNYEKYLESGISREQARMILPLNLYTSWYWQINLHNLLHFLALRCDAHAQWETRVFADAMLELIKPIVPVAIEAWEDYHISRGAIKLTKLEVDAVRSVLSGLEVGKLASDNKREQEEWVGKAKKLGLTVRTS